jgi:hypothetical protein
MKLTAVYGLWCLMPLSTIFQLYRGGSCIYKSIYAISAYTTHVCQLDSFKWRNVLITILSDIICQ